ncbi:chaperonin 10-like protein [Talaromyces proteolyticus]|uniref:Chaperonin 10-like protein n=1 Tax=Talaromyces proteolyticus TaxID=1131652 RepID=A0AAD4KNT1_9EURO|nr:chaperonin 10-like protein [Talaromyces proteolyticus]KAH8697117.1 chaperonin 10-like protein [Talaromyces proteolyticus]
MATPNLPSDTMLAAVLEQFGEPYSMQQIPRPGSPQGQDILIKVLAASYCHTDAVFASGQLSQDLPRVGCHEFAGEIIALGPDVSSEQELAVGVRVGVPGRAYHPCGACYECTHPDKDIMGYSPYCPSSGNLGLTRDGGFQQYCLVDSRQVAMIPDGLTATQTAPLMCAGLTIWAALHHDKVRWASGIAILGAGGGLGHLGVQFAAHLGMQVLAIDANDRSLELLQQIKATLGPVGQRVYITDARKYDISAMPALIQKSSPDIPVTELGVDAVILLPESQAAFDMGMNLLRNHGTMVVVSFPEKKLEVSAHDLVFRDINVVGSLVGRNHQLREMLVFATKHGVSAKVKTFPFEQLNNLVEEYHKGYGGKLVVDMTL